MVLNREQLLTAPRVVEQPFGKDGDAVRVKLMTAAEAADRFGGFAKLNPAEKGKRNRALVASSIVGADNEPLLTADEVASMPVGLFSDLSQAVLVANGLGDVAGEVKGEPAPE